MSYPTTSEVSVTAKRDLTEKWESLHPVIDPGMGDTYLEPLVPFLAMRRIEWANFVALEPRWKPLKNGDIDLAFAHRNHAGTVTGIKYRRLSDGKRTAEPGSATVLPQVVGNRSAKDWIVAEGETDAARLLGLTKGTCAIFVLPAGALALRPEWVGVVPRGARVWLAHDNDAPGEKGAEKAALMIPGALRLRPPGGFKDWCEWPGTSEEFGKLVREAQEEARRGLRAHTMSIFEGAVWFEDKMKNPLSDEELGVETPFPLALGRLRPGRLYVLGGYPADGKTSTMLQFLRSAQPEPVGIMSIEMTRKDLIDRIVASYGVPLYQVETGAIHPEYLPLVQRALKEMALWHGMINDDPNVTDEKIFEFATEINCSLLCVDHLHRLDFGDRRHLERIVRAFKNAAKVLDIPVLLLAQLTRLRGMDGTAFPRPDMTRLRESGLIEAEADAVWFLWRHRDEHDLPLDKAELIIAKDRFNQPGIHRLTFHGAETRYEYEGKGPYPETDEYSQVF